jgi:E3 SUMO-protein ligase RanBP2
LPSVFGTGNFTAALSTISKPKQETNADDNGEDDGEDESYEPDTSFKPIVQLSAVEVKTGEEDENVLFCERAKLYRFDSATNQMKERGIGEMKILQHKTTNLCRILMRREQVLKICANHQITSQMELKPHTGSANAYLWSAIDFADGEPKHETLCIRFKTDEQAKNFAKIFNQAKGINTNKSSDVPSLEKISLNDETKSNTNDDGRIYSSFIFFLFYKILFF